MGGNGHLKLTFESEWKSPTNNVQQGLLMAVEEREESLTLSF